MSLTTVSIFLAQQEITAPGKEGDWGDAATGATIAFGISLPLFIHQTLKGPLMETDEVARRRRASRNVTLGLTLYLIIFASSMVFFRDPSAHGVRLRHTAR